ncbi:MAG: hypothetical protein II990_00425 [Muribaculaceae bacterium]|nr:hypothetical protein [Muribaculaceae bacterium]
MTFRRLLPIIIVVAIVAGIGVIFLNLSGGSEAESGVESVAYGEHSKEIVVDNAAEVTGDLADYVSVVPGTYKLSYVSEEKGKYGNQEFVITLKLKLIKQYPHDPSSYQKLKFLTSRGTIGGLKLDLSRGSLDQTESDRFEKFVKEGNEGDEKEFMFYNSMSNREYADALFNEAHGIIFETDGYESTTSSSSTSSESMSSIHHQVVRRQATLRQPRLQVLRQPRLQVPNQPHRLQMKMITPMMTIILVPILKKIIR